jgi:uncharacterized protein YdeI (YjbR/CyaY-like superfamily)
MKTQNKLSLHKGIKTVQAPTRKEWRSWLSKNHETEKSVWLIIYHKTSDTKSVYYDEAVEEALCFGWIDSLAHKRDEESSYLFFSPRKPKSKWSKVNRDRVEKLIKAGLMTESGQRLIDIARETGTWEALVNVENSVIPPDLEKRFARNKTARKNFDAFPPSSRRIILEWIMNAKRPETRKKRLDETVALATKNIRANHYQR